MVQDLEYVFPPIWPCRQIWFQIGILAILQLTYLDQYTLQFQARTAVPTLVSNASGVVIDLGPALGNQVPSFDRDKISHIYGIEKNPFFLEGLQKRVQESEIQNKYSVISCGIEDTDVLEGHGIRDGNVDTILCIQVLCSVSDPEAVARGLYKLLKPGGKLIFWEHHRSHDIATRAMQCKFASHFVGLSLQN